MSTPVDEKRGFAAIFPRVPVASRAAKWTLGFLVYAALVGAVSERMDIPQIGWGTEATAVFGLIVGFLVAFRNNAAYSRWWEARQLWGQLVNDSRNLALKVSHYVRPSPQDRAALVRLLAGFGHALRLHLRGPVRLHDIPSFEQETAMPKHVPILLADRVFALLARWHLEDHMDSQVLRALDDHARGLMDVCGGCERIRNTPLPPSPSGLLRFAFFFYLLTAPAFILNEVGWWGLLPLGLGIFLLIAVEMGAEAIAEPFGTEGDDLDLERYCEVIEMSVREVLTSWGSAPL